MVDSYGDGWNGAYWTWFDIEGGGGVVRPSPSPSLSLTLTLNLALTLTLALTFGVAGNGHAVVGLVRVNGNLRVPKSRLVLWDECDHWFLPHRD